MARDQIKYIGIPHVEWAGRIRVDENGKCDAADVMRLLENFETSQALVVKYIRTEYRGPTSYPCHLTKTHLTGAVRYLGSKHHASKLARRLDGFRAIGDREAEPASLTPPVLEPEQDPLEHMTVMELIKVAQQREIDISDIRGKGSRLKLVERIKATPVPETQDAPDPAQQQDDDASIVAP